MFFAKTQNIAFLRQKNSSPRNWRTALNNVRNRPSPFDRFEKLTACKLRAGRVEDIFIIFADGRWPLAKRLFLFAYYRFALANPDYFSAESQSRLAVLACP